MTTGSRIVFFLLALGLLGGCKSKNPYFVNDVLLLSPESGVQLHRNQLLFKWKVVNALYNTLQISESNTFTNLKVDTIADTEAFISSAGIFDFGKTYYWQVLNEPLAGNTVVSQTRSFKIIDTRDSIVGTYPAQLRKMTWNLPSNPLTDTTYTVNLVIAKQTINKLKMSCPATPSLPDMAPHPDNTNFHFGNDGLGSASYQFCKYDSMLRRINIEFVLGDVNAGHHYWFTIYK